MARRNNKETVIYKIIHILAVWYSICRYFQRKLIKFSKNKPQTHIFLPKSLQIRIFYRNFASLDSATLPDDQRTRADLFYFGDMSTTLSSTYTKPALSIPDQIRMLKGRGLLITDDAWAEKLLEDISYFRIVAYLRPMELDHTTHQFKPGASLEKAYQLYDFDKKLRLLVFTAIQTIEISLRSRVIHHFSIALQLIFLQVL